MSTTNRVEPLGTVNDSAAIVDNLRQQLRSGNMPVITCANKACRCGFCAPKAEDPEEFHKLIKRHVTQDVFGR